MKASKEAIQAQAEEIKSINENLEKLVKERTTELERKNKALEEYAFVNAHKLRAPVASILGLVPILDSIELSPLGKEVVSHLISSSEKLDSIVHSITAAIESVDDYTTEEIAAIKDKVSLRKSVAC